MIKESFSPHVTLALLISLDLLAHYFTYISSLNFNGGGDFNLQVGVLVKEDGTVFSTVVNKEKEKETKKNDMLYLYQARSSL